MLLSDFHKVFTMIKYLVYRGRTRESACITLYIISLENNQIIDNFLYKNTYKLAVQVLSSHF